MNSKKLNGAKVVKCRNVSRAYRDTWNYGGLGKHHGIMYREGDPQWCWAKDKLYTNRALIFGVECFMWVYEKHPTEDKMWWCTHSVDLHGNII